MVCRGRLLLCSTLALSVALCFPAQTALCFDPENPCASRFGVNITPAYGNITDYALDPLNIGWYSDWGMAFAPQRPGGMDYAQIIRVSPAGYPPDWTNVAEIIAVNPGSLWIIGNEPDCISQDNRTPGEYAAIYHDCYAFIKQHDPTTGIAIGGVVVPTPLRREWLEQVLAAYQDAYGEPMPIDIWNIHVQILQEKRGFWGCGIPAGLSDDEGELYTIMDNADPRIFVQLVQDFRQWMADRGEQDKHLIISEFGVLMPSEYLGYGDRAAGDIVVKQFMTQVFDFLRLARDESTGCPEDGGRLVQRWLWYSLNEPYYDFETQTGMNGALFEANDPTQLTALGEHWLRYMEAFAGKGCQLYMPLHFPMLTQVQP